jgi:hypothetical protein
MVSVEDWRGLQLVAQYKIRWKIGNFYGYAEAALAEERIGLTDSINLKPY